MKKAAINPFESDFGFTSPGFIVDEFGNITARSISTVIIDDEATNIVDYTITDNGTEFLFSGLSGGNPSITLVRGTTYRFQLNLTNFRFFLFREDGISDYNLGLLHSDGDRGSAALGKTTGLLSITVPQTYTSEDVIIYSNEQQTVTGNFNLQYPTGVFGELTSNAGIASTSATTGTLKVDGGVGITGDVFIDGELNLAGVGIPKLTSLTNLEFDAKNKIIIKIDNTKLGEINSSALEIPLANSTINNTTISNSQLENTTVAAKPTVNNEVANKIYVDDTVTALAIALGI